MSSEPGGASLSQVYCRSPPHLSTRRGGTSCEVPCLICSRLKRAGVEGFRCTLGNAKLMHIYMGSGLAILGFKYDIHCTSDCHVRCFGCKT